MNTGLMDRFIDEYRPGANLKKPDKELLDFGEKMLPKAVNKLGALAENECFYFVPALVTGGAEDIKYIQKGDANVHQHMLFELGNR